MVREMPTIYPLHCFKCPILNHCPHNAHLASARFDNPGLIQRLSAEDQSKIILEDIERIQAAIEKCPLIKILHS